MKNTKKLALAGMLTAVAVVGSLFSVPVLGAKCSPVQHMVNVIAGVVLGPYYAVCMAFVASLIRNIMGIGSILAFGGSMIGAFLCGILYKAIPKLYIAYIGEVFGTGIIGAMVSYPIAAFFMNNSSAALFTFVPSFMVSTLVGSLISVFVLGALKRTDILNSLKKSLETN